MKHAILFLMLIVLFAGSCKKEQSGEDSAKNTTMAAAEQQKSENIFQFEVTDLYGDTFDYTTPTRMIISSLWDFRPITSALRNLVLTKK